MIPVCAAATVRHRDRTVIEQVGIPGRVLMEIAGRRAAEVVHACAPMAEVAVLCGPGNNGGDGFVVARWLALWGHSVRVWCTREPTTPDAQANLGLLDAAGVPRTTLEAALDGAGVVVDALLGTGQRSAPRGAIEAAIHAIRRAHAEGGQVVSLDLPTGVCGDTGRLLGGPEQAVRAHHTVTFGYWKPGLLCAPGAEHGGCITVVDIGLDLARAVDPAQESPDAWLVTESDAAAWLPGRRPSAAKWDRGHVAVRAGGGAAVLACLGAFAAGAGMVTLLAPRSAWSTLHGLDPSVILAEPDALDPRRHDALVIGPGLGFDHPDEVHDVWRTAPLPVVADADALTILAQAPTTPEVDATRVLTPHSAEAARLLGQSRTDVEAHRFEAVHALGALGLPVLKGPNTLVGSHPPWVSPFADERLAVAGSGDVLAGCIAAGLARKTTPREAAMLGVWLHGAAAVHMPTFGTARHLVDAIRTSAEALRSRSARHGRPA